MLSREASPPAYSPVTRTDNSLRKYLGLMGLVPISPQTSYLIQDFSLGFPSAAPALSGPLYQTASGINGQHSLLRSRVLQRDSPMLVKRTQRYADSARYKGS